VPRSGPYVSRAVTARLLLTAAAVMTYATAGADPLSVEPLIGVAAEYASNPFLATGASHGVSDEALSLDLPTHYDLDSTHFTLLPSVRVSDKGTYSSLNSDYFHLTGLATYSSDLQTLTLRAGANRDSSLWQYGVVSQGLGVRTDSFNAGADWQYALTERTGIELGGSWSRNLYDDTATLIGLVDYRYLSEQAGVNYAVTERNTLQLFVNESQYQSLDHITASHSVAAQLGITRQVTEQWTAAATLGYAKSDNSQSVYVGPFDIGGVLFGPYYEGTVKSVQRGPVFNASAKWKNETLTFSANASRTYAPTGFEYLSRQDLVALDLTKVLSERWSYAGHISYEDTSTPTFGGTDYTTHYYSARLSATWHWTPVWMISLTTNWVGARYSPPPTSAQSTNVALQVSRQFLRIDL
jgi:hypothetical protein